MYFAQIETGDVDCAVKFNVKKEREFIWCGGWAQCADNMDRQIFRQICTAHPELPLWATVEVGLNCSFVKTKVYV